MKNVYFVILITLAGIVSAQTPPPFDDSALAPLGLESRCALPAYPTFNVKTLHGAVGNGLVDDTVAIRATIADACAAGGGLVYLPTGDYAVSPQMSDGTWTDPYLRSQAFRITCNNVVFIGDGPQLSRLLLYLPPGLSNPTTTWQDISVFNSYMKIKRAYMFYIDSVGGPINRVQFRSMTIDGQAGYTGNFVVGGIPATGDGWDMTHKAIMANGPNPITGVLVFNSTLSHWRGEEIFGPNVDLAVIRSTIQSTNASALSTSGPALIANSTIGGTGDARVYNGVENFAFPGNVQTIQDSNISAVSNGIAFLSYPTGVLNVLRNNIHDSHFGIQFSEAGHNILISGNMFSYNANAMITTVQNLYPELAGHLGFDNLTISGNTFDHTGSALVVQQYGSGSFQNLKFQGNTVTSGNLLSGGFGVVNQGDWTGFTVDGTILGAAGQAVGGQYVGGHYALWANTTRPAGTGSVGAAAKFDQFSSADVETKIVPKTDLTWLNQNSTGGTHHYAVIDPAILAAYPTGFTTKLIKGASPWTLKADPAWNDFAADIPLTAAGVTITKNAAGVFSAIQ